MLECDHLDFPHFPPLGFYTFAPSNVCVFELLNGYFVVKRLVLNYIIKAFWYTNMNFIFK